MATIWVATEDGLHEVTDGSARGPVHLPGRPVTFVARAGTEVWAIADARELWHRTDESWNVVATMEGSRATCLAFTEAWLVGSSEAHLFRVADGGLTPVEAFDRADGRDAWYTPWGGPPDTRSMSEWDEHVYVNVHVGGILHTDDGGDTWSPTIDIDADVHQVTTTEGLVLAAAAGGLVLSDDRGATWTYRTDGLEQRYARGVTVWGDTVLVSTSRGPRGGQAAVYRTALNGGPFERCRHGLPEWFDDNIDSHCLDSPPDGPVAAFGTSDGRLFQTTDAGSTWERIVEGLPRIHRVLVTP
jgi:photosystem II stability/assembly factor-like uncharacterized protein